MLQLLGALARRMCVLSGGEFAFMEAISTVNFQQLKLAVLKNLYSHHALAARWILKCDLEGNLTGPLYCTRTLSLRPWSDSELFFLSDVHSISVLRKGSTCVCSWISNDLEKSSVE